MALSIALMAVVAPAAYFDLRWRRIPNWLSAGGVAIGIALQSFFFGWTGCVQSLEGLAAGFGVYFLLYLLRAMGAGDVKLMGAVGALAGPANWLVIFLVTAVLGGVIALVVVAWRGRLGRTLENVRFAIGEMVHLRAPYLSRGELEIRGRGAVTLPHGAVIALGCAAFVAGLLRPVFPG